MKLQNSFVSSLLIGIQLTLVFNSAALFSSTVDAAEAVKATKSAGGAARASDENLPTSLETNMGAVKSPYKACAGVVLVEKTPEPPITNSGYQAWKQNHDFWAKYPAPPTCDPKTVSCTRKVQYIPSTSFVKAFNGQPGVNLSSKQSAVDFLADVAKKSVAALEARIPQLEARRNCFKTGAGECAAQISKFKESLKTDIPQFRYAIANLLEKSPKVAGTAVVTDSSKQLIERNMSEAGKAYLVPSNMAPMTDDEFKAVEKNLNSLLAPAWKANEAQTKATIARLKLPPNKAEEELTNAKAHNLQSPATQEALTTERAKNLETYIKLLSANPDLGYVGDPLATNNSITRDLTKQLDDAKDHLKEWKEALGKKKAILDPSKMDSNLLQFAAHSRTIENMIAAENKEGQGNSCAVAMAVANELSAVQTRNNTMYGTAVVAASLIPFGVGTLVGGMTKGALAASTIARAVGASTAAIGLVGGSAMDYADYKEKGETADMARVGAATVKDGIEAVAGQQGSIVMAPLNFMGTGALWGGIAGTAGGIVAAKVTMAKLIKDGRSGGGGAAKATAEKLTKQIAAAEAGDKSAAAAALKTATESEKVVFGHQLTEADNATLNSLVKKGLLGTAENPNSEAIDALKIATQGKNPVEVGAINEQIQTIAKNLPGDLGSAERREAVGAAIPRVSGEVPSDEAVKLLSSKEMTPDAITGWSALVEKMKSYAGDKATKFRQAWTELATRAKMSKDQIANWKHPFCCSGFCPKGKFAGIDSPWEMESNSREYVCSIK